jgi:chromosome segregation ATPase
MAIAAVVIVALLAVNAWLLYKYTQADKAQEKLTVELDETNALQEELNEKYYEARAELESMRTGNAELNALIEQQQEELKASKDRISRLLRSNGNLEEARGEIAKLRQQAESYLAELNQLREENALLNEENAQLAQERDNLSSDLNMQLEENQNLTEQRALLVSEKEQLSSTNQDLSQKVTRASTIKVAELEANGQKLRRSGKAVTRRDADNVDRIEVCFNTTINEIAESGREIFHLRIVNSQGETLTLDKMGSGTFINRDTGQPTRFTLADEMDYDGTPGRGCMIWAPGQQFSPGNYTVEIYNKGFLAGTTTLRLR